MDGDDTARVSRYMEKLGTKGILDNGIFSPIYFNEAGVLYHCAGFF
jgi:hypothetical protein